MRDAYDDDWYKFKLSSKMPLKIGFTQTSSSNSGSNYFRVTVKDANRNMVKYLYVKASTKKTMIDAGTLKAGTYYVVVESYSSSYWSTAPYTLKAVTQPGRVSSLKGVSASYNAIKLTWAKPGTVDGYEVYRATKKTGNFTKIKTVGSGSTLVYTNSGLTSGKTYYYKVRTYRIAGSTKVYGKFSSITAAKPVPSKPSNIVAKRRSSSSIRVEWSKVSGASGYEIYRKTTGDFTRIKTVEGRSTLNYTNKSLTKGKTYTYKVRAYKVVSGKKVYGSFSKTASAKP